MKNQPFTNLKDLSTRALIAMMAILVMIAMPMSSAHAAACTFTSTGNGNWNAAGTWTTSGGTGCGTYPGASFAGDIVVIGDSDTVTVNVSPANPIASLTFGTGSGSSTVSIGSGFQPQYIWSRDHSPSKQPRYKHTGGGRRHIECRQHWFYKRW